MDATAISDDTSFQSVVARLPHGFEEAARERGALVRRRAIRSATDLLRLVMAYSLCDCSLRTTAVLALARGIGDLSDVAVLKRLRGAADWLAWLVFQKLVERQDVSQQPGLRVRVLDASVVNGPGATQTQWRLHMGLDLARETIQSVELTGPEGGETLWRHDVSPGEVLLCDRGYSHRQGVAHVLDHGGHVVLRLNWQSFPLEDEEGKKIDLLAKLEELSLGEVGDCEVWFRHEGRRYPVRLVGQHLKAAPTGQEMANIRRCAARKGRRPDPRTTRASCFVILLTSMERGELSASQALDLYRLRWRIETAFKRLKSLLHLDRLRADDPKLVATYIHGKLLAAILLEEISPSPDSFPPCPEYAVDHT